MRVVALALAAIFSVHSSAWAFCGFYVATADEPLTNKASRVVLVRDGDHTIVTMASDVHGDAHQFALVIPVPTVIKREQVRIVKPQIVEHLADYSKPRLVQYFDPNPCETRPPMLAMAAPPAPLAMGTVMSRADHVHIEAAFSVEEYDIVVLSASDSDGLIDWLNRNGYHMPTEAAPVIGSYLRQHMHFFVAKVNLDRMKQNTSGFLRPIRVEYDTAKFMLPIRLGTVNAAGPQDMLVFALSRTGRTDVTNYRTVRMPSGDDVPEYVQDKFGAFYDAVFDRQFDQSGRSAVFLEYAWPVAANVGLCDPCSSLPLAAAELDELGVSGTGNAGRGGTPPLFLTRLHVRYDRDHFPEDLQFQETPDTQQYQARFVTHVAFKRRDVNACWAGYRYMRELHQRWQQENDTLVRLTGWNPSEIHQAMVEQWNRTREQ